MDEQPKEAQRYDRGHGQPKRERSYDVKPILFAEPPSDAPPH
jgi:hypothetical protein